MNAKKTKHSSNILTLPQHIILLSTTGKRVFQHGRALVGIVAYCVNSMHYMQIEICLSLFYFRQIVVLTSLRMQGSKFGKKKVYDLFSITS